MEAEQQKLRLQEDWAQKMAGAEQDQLERIAQLDREMTARQADAEKSLEATKVYFNRSVILC